MPSSLQLIANEIPYDVAGDMTIEFCELQQKVLLDLPKGKIGEGWELVPVAEPTEVSDHN